VDGTVNVDVEGLGPFAERTFLGGTLADFTGAGRVVVSPNTIVGEPAILAALALAKARGDVRAAPDGAVCTPGVWLFASRDGTATPERIAAARAAEFDALERELPNVAGQPLRVADAWAYRVDHWSDLLWANLLTLGPTLWARLASPWAVGWAALRAGSVKPELVAGGLVERGADSFVHPHATVEFSVLGKGARVGAGAVVRGCFLQDGAVVEELAMVEGCVLGRGARIQRQAMAKYSVIEAAAAHAGTVQLGVIGAGAQVRHGAALFDQSLGAPVRVRRAGALVEAPRGMIGVCVGPGALLGQGVRVAAGRAIPAGLTVLPDPGGVLAAVEVPAGTTRAHVRGGRLEPLA